MEALRVVEKVSTHASARDATLSIITLISHSFLFQLTRPRGTRLDRTKEAGHEDMFQLTRPRGTRRLMLLSSLVIWSFNSRVREGRDNNLY